jgi:DNA polymerase-3 subunit delta
MQLKSDQLNAQLTKSLAPVYFFTGDEPLQVGELADAVRKTARKADYNAREVFSVDNSFEWNSLSSSANELSLFSDKKIIELRLPTGSFGTDGAKVITAYCERLPQDTLLIITAAKLAKESLKTKWFAAIDKVGIVIQVWALDGADLMRWLQQRCVQRGLILDNNGLRLLASRIEGNLLAAAQEIEKLYVLYGAGNISRSQINEVVADSSRYDVFKLVDCLFGGNIKRIIKVLSALQAEGTAAPVVLWALSKEARVLIKIKQALSQGQNRDTVFRNHQIWDKRKQVINDAIARISDKNLNQILVLSAKADRQIKGQQSGDAWETLLAICLLFTALTPL